MFWPSPGSEACISVTTARMSAMASDTRTPDRMSGSAPGSATLARTSARRISSVSQSSTSCGSVLLKPCTAAKSTGHSEPKAITAVDMAGESPRNRIATGMIADAGSGLRKSSSGSRYSRARREVPIAAPSAMPSTQASAQP